MHSNDIEKFMNANKQMQTYDIFFSLILVIIIRWHRGYTTISVQYAIYSKIWKNRKFPGKHHQFSGNSKSPGN